VAKYINSGSIGRLKHILVVGHTFAPRWNGWKDERWLPEYGVLYDFLPHLIDSILWVSQGLPRRVMCRKATNREDNAYNIMIELDLPDGTNCTSMISVEWATSTSRRIVCFFGTERDLYLDLQDQFVYSTSGYLTPLNRMPMLALRTISVLRRIAAGGLTTGYMVYHRPLLQDFLSSIRRGESPRISVYEGIANMAVIDAAVRSLKEDAQVELGTEKLL
jgi:predicted dehydrogenase